MKKIWNKNEKNMEKKCLVLVTSRIVRECILFKWKITFFLDCLIYIRMWAIFKNSNVIKTFSNLINRYPSCRFNFRRHYNHFRYQVNWRFKNLLLRNWVNVVGSWLKLLFPLRNTCFAVSSTYYLSGFAFQNLKALARSHLKQLVCNETNQ